MVSQIYIIQDNWITRLNVIICYVICSYFYMISSVKYSIAWYILMLKNGFSEDSGQRTQCEQCHMNSPGSGCLHILLLRHSIL